MFGLDHIRKTSISRRLMLSFLLVSLVPLFLAGFITFYTLEKEFKEERLEDLRAFADSKDILFSEYIREKEEDVRAFSFTPIIVKLLEETHPEFLKRERNSPEYSSRKTAFKDFSRNYFRETEYYDNLLVDTDGNVLYSVKNEADLGSNLNSGPYRDTEIAKTYKLAVEKGETRISDFRYYPVSGMPAAFIGAPVRKGDSIIGAVILQLDNEDIYREVKNYSGLGKTGEIVLAAREGDAAVFISPLRHDPDAAFKRHVRLGPDKALPVQRAVLGETGAGVSVDYRGREILAAWRYLPKLRWGIVVKIDADEAFAHLYQLRRRTFLIGMLTAVLVILMAFRISRSISAPIKALHKGSEIVGSGNLDYRIGTDADDEIGRLSRAFDEMTVKLKSSMKILENEIAARKEIEDRLVKSEQSYRTLAENIPGIVYRVFLREDNQIKFFSRYSEAITGFRDIELKEGKICSLESRIHPEDQPAVVEKVTQAVADNTPFSCEYRFMHRDGNIRYFLELGAPVNGDDGKPLYIEGIILDITGQKLAEQALIKEKEKLQKYLDISAVMVVMIDAQQKVTLINRKGCDILGYEEHEIIGKNWFDNFLPQRIRDDVRSVFLKLMNGDIEPFENYENPVLTRSGEERIIAWYNTVFRDKDDNILATLGSGADITERIKAEQLVRESELLLSKIYNSLNEAVLVLTPDRVFRRINRVTEEMFGYSADELLGRSTEMLHVDHEHYVEFGRRMKKAFDMGETAMFEFSAKRKNGEIFPTEHVVSLLMDDSGRQLGIVSVVRDITERRRAEEKLKSINREMEQIIQVTSHDLRTPLAVVNGYSREMEKFIEKLSPVLEKEGIDPELKKALNTVQSDIRDTLKYIQSNTRKMDSLLYGLLKLSRSGRVELHIEEIDMNNLISDVLTAFRTQILETKATLDISELPSCRGDETQINQVFSNLIGNALKYLDPVRPCCIRISGLKQAGRSVYCVEDNGIGIAPEHHEKIFEIFHQVRRSPGSGEGLGLTMVQKILERHNGSIWLESEPGKGSRFFVSLPA